MAKNNNLTDFLTDIADTIRKENGTTELINPQDFGSKITEIGNKLRNIIQGTLTEVTAEMLEGVTEIRDNAFYDYSSLISIDIPNSVTSIGNSAFYGCSNLTSVTMGNGITSIGRFAFYVCTGLTTITIPNSVTSIDEYVFQNCTGLTSVTIGNSVTSIGKAAFAGCKRLTSIKFMGQPPTIQSNTFYDCNSVAKYDFRGATSIPTLQSTSGLGHASGCQIIVPDSLYDSWQQATNWSALTNVVWVKASEYAEE